jgi:hypothetical protein
MIVFKDFVPKITVPAGILSPPRIESFNATVQEMNAWIVANSIRVVNVETVVLPNIHSAHEEGSHDTSLRTSGDLSSTWHQFIRVWCEVTPPHPLLSA